MAGDADIGRDSTMGPEAVAPIVTLQPITTLNIAPRTPEHAMGEVIGFLHVAHPRENVASITGDEVPRMLSGRHVNLARTLVLSSPAHLVALFEGFPLALQHTTINHRLTYHNSPMQNIDNDPHSSPSDTQHHPNESSTRLHLLEQPAPTSSALGVSVPIDTMAAGDNATMESGGVYPRSILPALGQ